MKITVKNGQKILYDEGVIHMRSSGMSDTLTVCGMASWAANDGGWKGTSKAVTCNGCLADIQHIIENANLNPLNNRRK